MTERIRRRAYLRCRDELDPKIPFPLFVVFFSVTRNKNTRTPKHTCKNIITPTTLLFEARRTAN